MKYEVNLLISNLGYVAYVDADSEEAAQEFAEEQASNELSQGLGFFAECLSVKEV